MQSSCNSHGSLLACMHAFSFSFLWSWFSSKRVQSTTKTNKQMLCMCLKSKSLCFVLTSKRNKCLVTEFLKKGKIPLNLCQLECHSSITSCLLTQKSFVEVRDFSAIFFFFVYPCQLSTYRRNILIHLCTILTAAYLHIWLPHAVTWWWNQQVSVIFKK